MCESHRTTLPQPWVKKEKPLPSTQVLHVGLYIWLSTSPECSDSEVCSKPLILPYLKAWYVIPTNKGQVKCHKVIHYFKRCSSNLSYTPVADLVPCCHDTGSPSRFRDLSRLSLNKGKTQFCCISNKKPVAGVKELSLDDWEKGQQPQRAWFCPPPAYCVVQQISRSSLPDEPRREHSHTVWMLLPFSCPAVACKQSKPWCNKLLRFSFISMKDAMMFTILSLETTSFSLLNSILYTFYHTFWLK